MDTSLLVYGLFRYTAVDFHQPVDMLFIEYGPIKKQSIFYTMLGICRIRGVCRTATGMVRPHMICGEMVYTLLSNRVLTERSPTLR